MKTTVAVYDTKPYDRESFARVADADAIDIASTTVENVKRLTAGEPFLEGTSL